MSEMEIKIDIENAERIDFDIFKEGWNRYNVDFGDGNKALLIGRVIVTKVLKTDAYDEKGRPVYIPAYNNIFTTTAPKKLRGKPSGKIDDKTRLENIEDELEYETLKETWNEYRLKDGTILRVKLVVTGVQSTNFFSHDGEPLLNINSQPVMRIIVPPDLMKK